MLSLRSDVRSRAAIIGASCCATTGGAGSGCGTSSGTIFSMSVLSHVTSTPLRSVRITESPLVVCPFTDRAQTDVMKTISADAIVATPARRAHVATATWAILRTFIGTNDPTTWLGHCPERLQSSFYLGSK